MALRNPHNEKVFRVTTVLFAASPYSVLVDDENVLADATGGAILLALPALATVRGLEFVFKKTDATVNAVTLDGSGAETIDGALTYVLVNPGDAVTLLAPDTGTDWKVTGDGATTRLTPTSVSSELWWGNNGVTGTTTTRFLTPGWGDANANTTTIQYRVTRAGTLRNMRVRHNTTAGNGNAIVYTLRVNGVASALSVSLASTASDGSDLANTVVVAAGDLIDIIVTKAASVATSPSDIALVVQLGP